MDESMWLAWPIGARLVGIMTRRRTCLRTSLEVPAPSDRKLRLFAAACGRALYGGNGPAHWNNVWLDQVEAWADGGHFPHQGDAWNGRPQCYIRDEPALEALVGFAALAAEWLADEVTRHNHRCAGDARGRIDGAGLARDVFGNPFRPSPDPLGPRCGCVSGVVATWDNQARPCPECGGTGRVGPAAPWLAWNGRTIPRLARAIYDGREWGRLPILADALEEAGCADPELVRHCRGESRCDTCRGCGTEYRTVRDLGRTGEGYKTKQVNRSCLACAGRGRRPSAAPHVRGCWAVDLILGKP